MSEKCLNIACTSTRNIYRSVASMNYNDDSQRNRSRSRAYDAAPRRNKAYAYDDAEAEFDRSEYRRDDYEARHEPAARARSAAAPEYDERRIMSYDEYMAEHENARRSASYDDPARGYDGDYHADRRRAPQVRSDYQRGEYYSGRSERSGGHAGGYNSDAYRRADRRRDARSAYSARPEDERRSGGSRRSSRAPSEREYNFDSDSGYRHTSAGRRPRESHAGRNLALVLTAVALLIALPLTIKSGIFSRRSAPNPDKPPFDDVFANPTAAIGAAVTQIPTVLPAPTEAPTPSPQPGRVLDPNKKAIAITFDDGPSKQTRKILETLAAVDGRATFFVVGERLDDYADTLRMEHEAGCQIGMHTYDHANLTKLSESKILDEINSTNELILKHTGIKSHIVRPPYGVVNSKVKETVEQSLINWSLDTRDWESRNAESVYNEIMNNVEDGDIILMHDLYSSTAEAVARVVPELVERGYQLCTIDELFELKGIELHSGTVFRSAKQPSAG